MANTLINLSGGTTQFSGRDGRAWLSLLCGMPTGRLGEDTGPVRTQGPALLQANGRRYEGGDLVLEALDETDHAAVCRWRVGGTGLRLITRWQGCAATGIVSRCDTLTHTGDTPVTVTRCLARVAFPQGHYECYSQASRWCHENQGAWQPLHTGLALRHPWGRTTEESTPYLALRVAGSACGIACHILPQGNWTLRISPVTEMGELPFAVVELGLADENLNRVLQPGESLALPEILFQPLPQGEAHLGAPALHRYLLARHFAAAKPEAPVVFNTWLDKFDILDVPRLRTQLSAAKGVGCEVFMIDAGWYGAGSPNWWAQAGDWREKSGAAFYGNMRAFADEVRAAGLGFGIWMEPERFGPEAPIREEHPEWFVVASGAARIDLTQPAAYAYLRREIGRLVETYGLVWMKVDFNFSLDADVSGTELAAYTTAWYRLLDDVRTAYPGTFFEGCSSGAMRGDLSTLSHFDGHFISDSANPTDVLRIGQGAWLRLPPGRIGRWAVVRSAGPGIPRYGNPVSTAPPYVLVPRGAIWEPAELVDLGFALRTALPGMFGLSGDLAGLTDDQRDLIQQHVTFYKHWRRFITGAVAHLLTPPGRLDQREGWVAFQLQQPDDDTSLVFVYRLGSAGAPPPLQLHGLHADRHYRVRPGMDPSGPVVELAGEALMNRGLPLTRCWKPADVGDLAQVCVIEAVTVTG